MKIRAMLAFTSLLVVAPVHARAQDYCLSFPGSGYTLVGKGFVVPKRGQCRAWIGFSPLGGFDAPSAGTGCLSSDGTKLSFTTTTAFDFVTLFDAIALNMPSQSGEDEEQGIETGQTFFASAGVQGKVCAPINNPIPNVEGAPRPRLSGLR